MGIGEKERSWNIYKLKPVPKRLATGGKSVNPFNNNEKYFQILIILAKIIIYQNFIFIALNYNINSNHWTVDLAFLISLLKKL